MEYDPRGTYGHLSGGLGGQPPPPPPPPRPPARRSWKLPIALAVAAIVTAVAAAVVVTGGGDDEPGDQHAAEVEAASRSRTSTSQEPTTTTTALPYREPKPEDFSIAVVVLEKSCFGSAGCNVTYTVELTINSFLIDPDTTYQVIYEIQGGDEQQIKNIELTGDTYEYESESFIGTPTEDAVLTAVVTSVRAA